MDIRKCTGIVIEKDGKFLVCISPVTRELVWRDSPYDAWRTRRRDKAFIVSDKVSGKQMLFNPVTGQLREMVVV